MLMSTESTPKHYALEDIHGLTFYWVIFTILTWLIPLVDYGHQVSLYRQAITVEATVLSFSQATRDRYVYCQLGFRYTIPQGTFLSHQEVDCESRYIPGNTIQLSYQKNNPKNFTLQYPLPEPHYNYVPALLSLILGMWLYQKRQYLKN